MCQPHLPIVIEGGGERKMLHLVARYADACNLVPRPDIGRTQCSDRHCDKYGRDYASKLSFGPPTEHRTAHGGVDEQSLVVRSRS
jgi:hypothetical protein